MSWGRVGRTLWNHAAATPERFPMHLGASNIILDKENGPRPRRTVGFHKAIGEFTAISRGPPSLRGDAERDGQGLFGKRNARVVFSVAAAGRDLTEPPSWAVLRGRCPRHRETSGNNAEHTEPGPSRHRDDLRTSLGRWLPDKTPSVDESVYDSCPCPPPTARRGGSRPRPPPWTPLRAPHLDYVEANVRCKLYP